jgi:tRNA G37 N-methylase Trm5
VLLGLLPSAEGSYVVALSVLKPAGGVLHVHANKADGEAEAWAASLPAQLLELARSAGLQRQWTARLQHLEWVKSYAPRVWHVVADVLLQVQSPPHQYA